jgi:hypothetical protein
MRLVRYSWLAMTVLVLVLALLADGATFTTVHHTCSPNNCSGLELTRQQVNQLRQAGISLTTFALFSAVVTTGVACIFILIAGLIVWRRSTDRMALFTAFTLVLFGGFTFPDFGTTLTLVHPSWELPLAVISALGGIAFVFFLVLFPGGRAQPRWALVVVCVFAVSQAGQYVLPGTVLDPNVYPPVISLGLWVVTFFAIIYTQVHRYRNVSTSIERQQTKWVIIGISLALLGFLAAILMWVIPAYSQSALGAFFGAILMYGAMLLVPLSIGVAVLRYRLWDVDIIINRTLVYGSLTLSLAGIYIGSVIGLQAILRLLTGQGSAFAIALSTLAVAGLFGPLRRRIQAGIDRRFYRNRYDAALTLAGFGVRLRDEVDLDQLAAELQSVVYETVQPAHVSLWLRTGVE